MIQPIFSNNFYSLISAPNKDEIFETLKNIKVDRKATDKISWNAACEVEVEVLDKHSCADFLLPSINMFLSEMGCGNKRVPFQLLAIWKNTYHKGGFQELHDHIGGDGVSEFHLSGCFFLEDFDPNGGKFYFYNRHLSELNSVWRAFREAADHVYASHVIEPKAGDIIFFPSYMLHGVTVHPLRKPRRTLSFNIQMMV